MAMTSEIARAAGLETEPVALIWSDTKPEGALELKKDAWGCVMWLYARVARDGRTAAFSRETFGCAGGATGLGFSRPIDQHIARTEKNFCCFLSNGIEGAKDRTKYAHLADVLAPASTAERNDQPLVYSHNAALTPEVPLQAGRYKPGADSLRPEDRQGTLLQRGEETGEGRLCS